MAAGELWLEARRAGIGSSDAPVIAGVSRWSSPHALYLEKTGQAPREERDESWLEWGHRLEGPACDWYSDLSGRQVERWPQTEVVVHPERPWMRCTPDAVQEDDELGEGLLEVKCPLPWTRDEWVDGPPLAYQVQLQHQLEVTGHEWGTLMVLQAGERPRWWDVRRHDGFLVALVRRESEFWRRVETLTPPPVDGSQATAEALARQHREDNGETVVLPDEAAAWADRLDALTAELKELKAEKATLENQIKAAIGPATFGLIPGVKGRFKWAVQRRKGHMVAASESRVLSRLKR